MRHTVMYHTVMYHTVVTPSCVTPSYTPSCMYHRHVSSHRHHTVTPSCITPSYTPSCGHNMIAPQSRPGRKGPGPPIRPSMSRGPPGPGRTRTRDIGPYVSWTCPPRPRFQDLSGADHDTFWAVCVVCSVAVCVVCPMAVCVICLRAVMCRIMAVCVVCAMAVCVVCVFAYSGNDCPA
jgi:hypothetical protein